MDSLQNQDYYHIWYRKNKQQHLKNVKNYYYDHRNRILEQRKIHYQKYIKMKK